MCRAIPCRYVGHASRAHALARAVQHSASLQFGVTHLCWLDIVQQIIDSSHTEHGFGDALQQKVLQICPEYGRKITSWQHMTSICTRVDPQCFSDAEEILAANDIPKSILPQCWYREPHFLQPASKRKASPTKGGVGLEPLEQVCANRRMLSAVVMAWSESGESLTVNGLGRVVSSDDLKQYASLAKKFVGGMDAQSAETGITVQDCLPEFASGSCDGYLRQARDTTMAAYWPWVMNANSKKRARAEQEALAEAQRTADMAAQEEERLRQEEGHIQEEEHASTQELQSRREDNQAKLLGAAKCLFQANLRAYQSSLQQYVNEKLPVAVELWQRSDARKAAEAEDRTKSLDGLVFIVLPDTETNDFCTDAWLSRKKQGMPLVAYIDMNHGVPSMAEASPRVLNVYGGSSA